MDKKRYKNIEGKKRRLDKIIFRQKMFNTVPGTLTLRFPLKVTVFETF